MGNTKSATATSQEADERNSSRGSCTDNHKDASTTKEQQKKNFEDAKNRYLGATSATTTPTPTLTPTTPQRGGGSKSQHQHLSKRSWPPPPLSSPPPPPQPCNNNSENGKDGNLQGSLLREAMVVSSSSSSSSSIWNLFRGRGNGNAEGSQDIGRQDGNNTTKDDDGNDRLDVSYWKKEERKHRRSTRRQKRMKHDDTPVTSTPRNKKKGSITTSSSKLSPASTGPTTPTIVSPRRLTSKNKTDWLAKKQADYLTAIATPGRNTESEKKVAGEGDRTPVRTPRRAIKALNIATPKVAKKKKTSMSSSPKRRGKKILLRQAEQQDEGIVVENYFQSVLSLLHDKSKYENQIREAIETLHKYGNFPIQTRRLSMRDNDLICTVIGTIQNDPSIQTIEVDCDDMSYFGTVQTSLWFQFIDSLKLNIHLTTLQLRGVELGNDILYALATSIETNFTIRHLDLSLNCFTSEGLSELCISLGSENQTLIEVSLEDQTTPISIASQEDVIDAFQQNHTLTQCNVDFQSGEAGSRLLKRIMERNRKQQGHSGDKNTLDQKIKEVYCDMAEVARELDEQKKADDLLLVVDGNEDSIVCGGVHDWEYLYELAVLFDKHKLKKEVAAEQDDPNGSKKLMADSQNLTGKEKSEFLFGKFKDIMEESVTCFNSDGSFFTDEFISKYLVEDPDTTAVIFDFHGQWKLFKRFPPQDPHRKLIVTKFVDAIVSHSRGSEFTGISMANTGCGDDFLVELSQRLIDDSALLPNLQMVNFETNYVNETGVVALSKLISHPTTAKYLQVVRLENQKGLLKSKAEVILMKAMSVNRSVVVLGLRLRNLLEKQQIGKYLVRNIDLIRQARQQHAKDTGTERKRNEVEQLFDKVASNDPTIEKVDMSTQKRFLTLTREEKCKAASSLAHNTYVKIVNFNSCGIDDEFAIELGKAIGTNGTIEKMYLENNSISGDGVKCVFEGLAVNKSIYEIRFHHQSKLTNSGDEELLADSIESNETVLTIGIDLRNTVARVKLDRKLKLNRNNRLKQRAEAKQQKGEWDQFNTEEDTEHSENETVAGVEQGAKECREAATETVAVKSETIQAPIFDTEVELLAAHREKLIIASAKAEKTEEIAPIKAIATTEDEHVDAIEPEIDVAAKIKDKTFSHSEGERNIAAAGEGNGEATSRSEPFLEGLEEYAFLPALDSVVVLVEDNATINAKEEIVSSVHQRDLDADDWITQAGPDRLVGFDKVRETSKRRPDDRTANNGAENGETEADRIANSMSTPSQRECEASEQSEEVVTKKQISQSEMETENATEIFSDTATELVVRDQVGELKSMIKPVEEGLDTKKKELELVMCHGPNRIKRKKESEEETILVVPPVKEEEGQITQNEGKEAARLEGERIEAEKAKNVVASLETFAEQDTKEEATKLEAAHIEKEKAKEAAEFEAAEVKRLEAERLEAEHGKEMQDSATAEIVVRSGPLARVTSEEDSASEKSEYQHALDALAEACPGATMLERERFLTARKGDIPSAITALEYYLGWNSKHEAIAKQNCIGIKMNENSDLDIWKQACSIAMKAAGETGEPNLPQVIRTYQVDGRSLTDLDGYRVFHTMPAQMDHDLAQGSTYALATALFINLRLDRTESERITVCMDFRAGQGWPNIHAMNQVSFITDTTTLLLSLFPERLHRCLVYPVPSKFYWVWTVVGKIIDKATSEKISVLAGPNQITSPPPLEEMAQHLGKGVAEYLEKARVADFKG